MSRDDDWTGEPPEGRHGRERANPDFWRADWRPAAAGVGLAIALVVLVVVLLT